MRTLVFRCLSSLLAGMALASCGGESAVAIIGYIAPAGGIFKLDRTPTSSGSWDEALCDGQTCQLSIQYAAGVSETDKLYAPSLALEVTSGQLADVPAAGNPCAGATGTLKRDQVVLGHPPAHPDDCFKGRFLNVNQLVSDDGSQLLWFNFFPKLSEGTWVDIQDERHAFRFNQASGGCESAAGAVHPVTVSITASSFDDDVVADRKPFTLIDALTITRGATTETWSGRFVGASGMHLERQGAVLELERRQTALATCDPTLP